MLDQPFQRFPCQVQPVEIGIAVFQLCHQTKRMGIVIEAAKFEVSRIQRFFACMAERRGQGHGQRANASARSSSSASTRATERAICATSSECVSRVR